MAEVGVGGDRSAVERGGERAEPRNGGTGLGCLDGPYPVWAAGEVCLLAARRTARRAERDEPVLATAGARG